MKTTAITAWAGLALITAAQAGTPTTEVAPAPSAGLWQWFAGGSVGYLTQLDEAMYSVQTGVEYKTPGGRGSQAFYLQVGFAQDDASYVYPNPRPGQPPPMGGREEEAKFDLNIIPITLNYKYEANFTDRLSGYVGLGLGIAILDSSYDWSWSIPYPPFASDSGSEDRTDVRFYGEVCAGLSYKACDYFEVFGGVRYIFMDNVDYQTGVTGTANYTAGINNDVLIEVGARFRF